MSTYMWHLLVEEDIACTFFEKKKKKERKKKGNMVWKARGN